MSVRLRRPKLDIANGRIELSHGAGGRAMDQLVDEIFRARFDNPLLARGDDQARFALPPGRIAMTTDAYVVSPLFFPGGDIGALAVNGTVNDLAMGGAVPHHLAAAFVLEEGLELAVLARIADSMARAARAAGVGIVTGDTKVVERGKADGVFVTTTGIGVIADGVELSADRARPGDRVLVSGTIGDHGAAVMCARTDLRLTADIGSDTQPLHRLAAALVAACGPSLRLMRDPTRGGLAATLNELATASRVGMRLDEAAIPVRPDVAAVCEILGLDPLNVANEGKLVAIVAADAADTALAALRALPEGRDAALVGTVTADERRFVQLTTGFGGGRILDWLSGEQLPRIC